MVFYKLYTHLKRGYLLALLCGALNTANSQNYVELLKIYGSTTPLNKFDSSFSSSNINEYGLDATIPIKLNQQSNFITGLVFENIQTKLFSQQSIQSLSAISLKLGLSYKFNDRFTSTFIFLPKIASNFGRISNNDFQLGGIALFKYKAKENLHYKYGLYYNNERFGPFFVPMLGLYYLSENTKFELNAMLPIQLDVNYKIISLINIGINYIGQVRSYHVSNISPGLSSAYVSRVTNELYGYLKFNINKKLNIQTKVGHSIDRRYRVYNDNDKVDFGMPLLLVGNNRTQLNSDFSDGWIFQLGLVYRVDITK